MLAPPMRTTPRSLPDWFLVASAALGPKADRDQALALAERLWTRHGATATVTTGDGFIDVSDTTADLACGWERLTA